MLLSRNFPPATLSPFDARSGVFSSDVPAFELTDFWLSGAFLCFGWNEYDGNMTEGEPHVRCGLLVAGTSG